MENIASAFLGYFIAAISPEYSIAATLSPLINNVLSVYSGVFLNPKNFPDGS